MARKVYLVITFIIGSLVGQAAFAQSVSVDPKRIMFNDRDRSVQVSLINSGDKEAVYRISFEEMRMTKDGKLEKLKEEELPENYPDASSMVKYSPRQVTVPANGSQVVMFMARKRKDLPDGEYRSHVIFRAVPQESGKTLEDIVLKEGEVGVRITPVYGISIPLIIRHGNLSADVKLSDLKVNTRENGEKTLNVNLHRTGNRSSYGDFTALYTSANVKEPTVVGRLNGVAIYNGIESRPVDIYLNPPEGIAIEKSGKITLKYQETPGFGGDLSAEAEVAMK